MACRCTELWTRIQSAVGVLKNIRGLTRQLLRHETILKSFKTRPTCSPSRRNTKSREPFWCLTFKLLLFWRDFLHKPVQRKNTSLFSSLVSVVDGELWDLKVGVCFPTNEHTDGRWERTRAANFLISVSTCSGRVASVPVCEIYTDPDIETDNAADWSNKWLIIYV